MHHRIAPPQATSGNVPGFFMLRAADEAALPLRFQGTRPCRPAWSHSTSWVHYASARRWSWNGTGHEPSIGLHPSNVEGLLGVVRSLLADGNSTVIVDHDIQILRQADWLIEIGPGAGRDGGTIITSGTIDDIGRNDASRIAGFLTGREDLLVRSLPPRTPCSSRGASTCAPHRCTPSMRSTSISPVAASPRSPAPSGSGKTTLVLESLVPALSAHACGRKPPEHIRKIAPDGITRVNVVDASPIGINVRSTVATYSGVLDDLHREQANSTNRLHLRRVPNIARVPGTVTKPSTPLGAQKPSPGPTSAEPSTG